MWAHTATHTAPSPSSAATQPDPDTPTSSSDVTQQQGARSFPHQVADGVVLRGASEQLARQLSERVQARDASAQQVCQQEIAQVSHACRNPRRVAGDPTDQRELRLHLHACHICNRTGLAPATSAQDWACQSRCAATSKPAACACGPPCRCCSLSMRGQSHRRRRPDQKGGQSHWYCHAHQRPPILLQTNCALARFSSPKSSPPATRLSPCDLATHAAESPTRREPASRQSAGEACSAHKKIRRIGLQHTTRQRMTRPSRAAARIAPARRQALLMRRRRRIRGHRPTRGTVPAVAGEDLRQYDGLHNVKRAARLGRL
jgi:hypothetical protein